MRASRTDANQQELVAALRKMGCSVECLHAVGGGVPDLMVGKQGITLLMEVKDGKKPPSQRQLTKPQVRWHSEWRGHVVVVTSAEQAMAIINKLILEK